MAVGNVLMPESGSAGMGAASRNVSLIPLPATISAADQQPELSDVTVPLCIHHATKGKEHVCHLRMGMPWPPDDLQGYADGEQNMSELTLPSSCMSIYYRAPT